MLIFIIARSSSPYNIDPVFTPVFGPWSLVVIENEHGVRQPYPEKGYCNSSDGKNIATFLTLLRKYIEYCHKNGVLLKLHVLYATIKNPFDLEIFHLARFFTITLTYLGNLLYHYYGLYLQSYFLHILSEYLSETYQPL